MTLTRHDYGLPTLPQPDRLGMLLAYDEDRREVWGFGGFIPITFVGVDELWRWRIDEPELGWVRVPVLGPRPVGRSDAVWVYDSLRKNFLLAGGVDTAFTFLTDTWRFDPVSLSWTNLGASGLAARFPQMGVYDRARDRVVRFGGLDTGFLPQQDTQELDPSGTAWSTPSFSLGLPPVRAGHGMAYDETRQLMILFGGTTTAAVEIGDTWAYPVAGEWAQQLSAVSPSPRRFMIAAYHPRLRGVVISHGSFNGPSPPDGFLLTADGYRELHPSVSPDERDLQYATRIDALGGILIHGGVDQINPPFPTLVDTWVLDWLEEWSEPKIGFLYDRTVMKLDGGVTLVDPSVTASGTVERLFSTPLKTATSWDLVFTIPTNSQILIALILDDNPIYWDGAAWVASDKTESQRNTPADVSTNFPELPILAGGSLLREDLLFISDNGSANPEAEQIEIVGDLDFVGANLCEVFGVIDGRKEGVVVRAIYPSTGFFNNDEFIPADSVFRTTTDANGEFSLSIPETETVGQTVTVEYLPISRGTLQKKQFLSKTIPNQTSVSILDL